MKELLGSATGTTSASVEQCVTFLRDVERYPNWHPDVVRRVEVLERDSESRPTLARGLLHVAVGPLVKDFDLNLAITLPGPQTVKLARVPHHPGDDERFEVTWIVEEAGRTRIRLDLKATLPVPRLVPIGTVGDHLAQSFVADATKALDSQGA